VTPIFDANGEAMNHYGQGEFDGVMAEPSTNFAGAPDEFQRLWTPHRMAYITRGHAGEDVDDECPFCVAPQRTDEEGLIVHRGKLAFVILNLYPYNAGHMMVCPYRHVAMYDDATVDEVAEIASLTQTAMRVLKVVSRNEGFNIGMNQGRIAGAGVADHLHQHIVPRWSTDANFFPIIAKTKAIVSLLGDTRQALADAWPKDV
jgi:ATP adenylyltransferase